MGKRYSKLHMIDSIRSLSDILGRTPCQGELFFPGIRTYMQRFGSYEAALEEAGLPKPQIRFRWIVKRGCIITLDSQYMTHPSASLERVLDSHKRACIKTLERGYAVLRDSYFAGYREPERAEFSEFPQARFRMLTIYLGKRNVVALPEFPMSSKDILEGDYDIRSWMGGGLSVEKVREVVLAADGSTTIDQLAQKLTDQLEVKLVYATSLWQESELTGATGERRNQLFTTRQAL